jgi:hypothetical protein
MFELFAQNNGSKLNHAMNDLYVVPPPARQGIYLVLDTVLQYCIKH